MSNSNLKLGTIISITVDSVWAGSGNLVDGRIENCGAQFCEDNDESLKVYEQIEAGIAGGKQRLIRKLDGYTCVIEWTITEPN